MKLSEFKIQLGAHPTAGVVISLPDGSRVPRHFHVTEVGHVAKKFVDCGGKFRAVESCLLQTWTASARDDGHRLLAGKLQFILGLANSLLPSSDLPVEVEYEDRIISQFPVDKITFNGSELMVRLGSKHTDCVARERCGVTGEDGCAVEPAGASTGCAVADGGKSCCG